MKPDTWAVCSGKMAVAKSDTVLMEKLQETIAATMPDFTNTPEIKYLHVSGSGLGNYSRTTGYPKGTTVAEWRTFRMKQERGQRLSVDRMDDEETLNLTFGAVIGQFMREHVIPELDAYRFAKYAGTPGILQASGGTLTKTTIIPAIDEAVRAMNAKEVTMEGRVLFVNSDLQVALNQALNRQWGSDNTVNTILQGYNNMRIVYVPPTRFYTSVKLNDGTNGVWGYENDGQGINFMLVQPNAIVQLKKLLLPKIFSPDVFQEIDSWMFQFRLYHDAFVYENKLDGVYLHPNA